MLSIAACSSPSLANIRIMQMVKMIKLHQKRTFANLHYRGCLIPLWLPVYGIFLGGRRGLVHNTYKPGEGNFIDALLLVVTSSLYRSGCMASSPYTRRSHFCQNHLCNSNSECWADKVTFQVFILDFKLNLHLLMTIPHWQTSRVQHFETDTPKFRSLASINQQSSTLLKALKVP